MNTIDPTGSTANYAALDEDLRRQAIDAVGAYLLKKTDPKQNYTCVSAYTFAEQIVNLVLSKTRING